MNKGSAHPTHFNENANKICRRKNIKNGVTELFSNIGPAMKNTKCINNVKHHMIEMTEGLSTLNILLMDIGTSKQY